MAISLITNPATDTDFRAFAESCLAGVTEPSELADCLRGRYPRSQVVPGISEGETVRWYAYREGRWVASDEPTVADGQAS